MTALRTICTVLVVASLQGCAGLAEHLIYTDRRDAAWDPRQGRSLMDQIPNEDGGANRRCCGHLRSCERYQTPKC